MKKTAFIVILILTTCLLAGCSGAPTETMENVYSIGETFRFGGVDLTVIDVRTSAGGTEIKPAEGNEFFFIDVVAKNTGAEPVPVVSADLFTLYDADGNPINMSLLGQLLSKGSLDGQLAAGKVLRGDVAYEVARGNSGCKLKIGELLNAENVLTVDLGTRFDGEIDEASITPDTSETDKAVGDTFVATGLEITVDSMRMVGKSETADPGEGNVFMLVTVSVKNTSDKPCAFSTVFVEPTAGEVFLLTDKDPVMMMFDLRDDYGYSYGLNFEALNISKRMPDGGMSNPPC